MRIKLKMIGTGEEGDAYRVSIPTYHMVEADHDAMTAIVEIPNEVHGLSEEELANVQLHDHETGQHIEALHPTLVRKMHKHFDTRYRERKGQFRVELP